MHGNNDQEKRCLGNSVPQPSPFNIHGAEEFSYMTIINEIALNAVHFVQAVLFFEANAMALSVLLLKRCPFSSPRKKASVACWPFGDSHSDLLV